MTRLIKKYKNRRLYDTEISQYITIEDLQRYVIDGIDFRVEDSKTADDLTNATLLQIVVDMESGVTKFLSVPLLRQLIMAAQHPLNQSFKTLLENMFNSFGEQNFTESWNKNMQTMLNQWKKML